MPQYLTRKHHTFYFRQAVPQELRAIIGRREIKKSLGRDYASAVRQCKRYAVIADQRLAEARAQLDSLPLDPYSPEGIHRTRHVRLTAVTPELERQLATLVRASLLETDRARRIEGMDGEAYAQYGEEIDASLKALRRQVAMGQLEVDEETSMLKSCSLFLIGRGYDPQFSHEEWRRLAYVMTEATLEAFEGMAARQSGNVVAGEGGDLLPSQFEVQNAPKAAANGSAIAVTWQQLYDAWLKECPRPANTQAAYLAAMKLFNQFSEHKPPQAVTREDALAYRDFLRDEQGLAPGTVANKLGFVCTLFNAGRDHADHAKHLPQNPFADIRIKRAKRGKSGNKRLPFSDSELKTIFSSAIYTERHRPRGGGGEAAAWIPAIAYLTGMRLEEIATLHKRQFQVDSQGNPYIHIEDGKNANSADRDVPLHPSLIAAGLVDYARACPGPLFPKVKCTNEVQSKAYSQWYGRFLDSLGITAKSKVFHSFRHLFKDLCRNAGLDDSVIDQICGHEPGTEGGKYGAGRRIDVLAELIARVVPPVPVPVIFQR